MIRINLLSPSSIILFNIQVTPTWEKFLEAALLAGGIEIRWDNTYEYNENGYLVSQGKEYAGAREVGPCTERPPSSESQEQQI